MSGLRRSRAGWRALCQVQLEHCRETRTAQAQASIAVREVVCESYSRSFRSESDKNRHKCVDERLRPVCNQCGPVQCPQCQRRFRSKGGLAVHRCVPEASVTQEPMYLPGDLLPIWANVTV